MEGGRFKVAAAASLAIHAAVVIGVVASHARPGPRGAKPSRIDVEVAALGARGRQPSLAALAPLERPGAKASGPRRRAGAATTARKTTHVDRSAVRPGPGDSASSKDAEPATPPGSRWIAAVRPERLQSIWGEQVARDIVARAVQRGGPVPGEGGRFAGRPVDLLLIATHDPLAGAPLVVMKVALDPEATRTEMERAADAAGGKIAWETEGEVLVGHLRAAAGDGGAMNPAVDRLVVLPAPGIVVLADARLLPSSFRDASRSPAGASRADAGATAAAPSDGAASSGADGSANQDRWSAFAELVGDMEELMPDDAVAGLDVAEVFRAKRWRAACGPAGPLAGVDLPRALTVTLRPTATLPSAAFQATFDSEGEANAWRVSFVERSRIVQALTGLAVPITRVGVNQGGNMFRLETEVPADQALVLLELMLRTT